MGFYWIMDPILQLVERSPGIIDPTLGSMDMSVHYTECWRGLDGTQIADRFDVLLAVCQFPVVTSLGGAAGVMFSSVYCWIIPLSGLLFVQLQCTHAHITHK